MFGVEWLNNNNVKLSQLFKSFKSKFIESWPLCRCSCALERWSRLTTPSVNGILNETGFRSTNVFKWTLCTIIRPTVLKPFKIRCLNHIILILICFVMFKKMKSKILSNVQSHFPRAAHRPGQPSQVQICRKLPRPRPLAGSWAWALLSSRAVNKPSRGFTMSGEDPRKITTDGQFG